MFSARVIILGWACRCSWQGGGQEAPGGEVSVGRQQRMQSWEEDMSGPWAEDRHVEGLDRWGKLRREEEEGMSGRGWSKQGAGGKVWGEGEARAWVEVSMGLQRRQHLLGMGEYGQQGVNYNNNKQMKDSFLRKTLLLQCITWHLISLFDILLKGF